MSETHPVSRRREAIETALVITLLMAVVIAERVARDSLIEMHYRSNEGIYVISVVITYWKTLFTHAGLLDYLRCGNTYAPLPFLLPQPLMWLGPTSITVLRSLNAVYLLTLMVSLHLLARTLTDRREAGWLAMTLLITFGSIFDFTWYFNQLLLTAQFIALTLFALFSSDWMRNRRRVMLAAVFAAAAMMSHRGSPLLMLGPPVLLYAVLSWRATRTPQVPRRLLLFAVLALPLAVPHMLDYYVFSGHVVPTQSHDSNSYVMWEIAQGLHTPEKALYFFQLLSDWQLTPKIGLIWIPAAIWAAWTARRDPRRAVVLAAAVLPMLWLGVFKTKNRDFAFPVVPLWAVMIALAANAVPGRRRRPVMVLLAATALFFGVLRPSLIDRALPKVGTNDPALDYACRETIDALRDVPEHGAVVIYNQSQEGFFSPFGRDLLGCVHLTRPDLRAGMMNLGIPLERPAGQEVWVIRSGAEGYDAAVLLADGQLRVAPEITAHQPNEPLRGFTPPPRPPVRKVLPAAIQPERFVVVFDEK